MMDACIDQFSAIYQPLEIRNDDSVFISKGNETILSIYVTCTLKSYLPSHTYPEYNRKKEHRSLSMENIPPQDNTIKHNDVDF